MHFPQHKTLDPLKVQHFMHDLRDRLDSFKLAPTSQSSRQFVALLHKLFATLFGDEGWIVTLQQNMVKGKPEAGTYQQLFMQLLEYFSPASERSFLRLLFQFYGRTDVTLPREWCSEGMKTVLDSKSRSQQVRLSRLFEGSFSVRQDQVRMQIPEWIFCTLIHHLNCGKPISHRRFRTAEDYTCDYFYQDYLESPIVLLLRRLLQFYSASKTIDERRIFRNLLGAVRQYLVPQLPSDQTAKRAILSLPRCQQVSVLLMTLTTMRSMGITRIRDSQGPIKFQDALQAYIRALLMDWEKDLGKSQLSFGDLGRLFLLVSGCTNQSQKYVLQQARQEDRLRSSQDRKSFNLAFLLKGRKKNRLTLPNYSPDQAASKKGLNARLYSLFIERMALSRDLFAPVDIIFLQNSLLACSQLPATPDIRSQILLKLVSSYEVLSQNSQIKDKQILRQQFRLLIEVVIETWKVPKAAEMVRREGGKRVSSARPNYDYSQWEGPISSGQNSVAYFLLFNLALAFDRLRGISQPVPRLKLRPLAKYSSLMVIGIICFLAYSLV